MPLFYENNNALVCGEGGRERERVTVVLAVTQNGSLHYTDSMKTHTCITGQLLLKQLGR